MRFLITAENAQYGHVEHITISRTKTLSEATKLFNDLVESAKTRVSNHIPCNLWISCECKFFVIAYRNDNQGGLINNSAEIKNCKIIPYYRYCRC
jgi:hypothetical protein